jgi:HD-GYP domain-containing protein (c-di-GMP phosphodiesterase class II)
MNNQPSIEKIIRDISSTIQSVRIYTVQHPRARKAIDELFNAVQSLLSSAGEVSFGLAGDELFSGKDIFFHLTGQLSDFIKTLRDVEIERVRMRAPLMQQELSDFLEVLAAAREGDTFDELSRRHNKRFASIEVGKMGGAVSGADENDKNGRKSKQLDSLLHCYQVYGHMMETGSDAISRIAGGEQVDYEALYNFSCDVFNLIVHNQKSLFALMGLKRHDDYTFIHCLNVGVLSMYQARYLGFPQDQAIRLGMAGLFHDVGKIAIKNALLNKGGKLSDAEFENIKSHPVIGAELLLRNQSIDKLFFIACMQHHMGVDLSRYPRTKYLKRQSLAARIVAVSDVYDALRSRRSYKAGMSLERVHDIMRKESGTLLDAELVNLFFKYVGIWPVGTLVMLESGEVGQVSESHPDDNLSPSVELLFDREGNRLETPVTVDVREKDAFGNKKHRISRHLTSEGEGARYVKELFGEPEKSETASDFPANE